ncbi:MAG: hypothetical protein EZS28_048604 [Streblomastix strix]|uniref:Uncharacterized protein n=1 Tax=Streblomastix strix TaxID=222440 RepID=A0A5J4TCM1_9EUKA|nr:MAG: hypothetical protein EZS28_048604 [Streblomastix strix]
MQRRKIFRKQSPALDNLLSESAISVLTPGKWVIRIYILTSYRQGLDLRTVQDFGEAYKASNYSFNFHIITVLQRVEHHAIIDASVVIIIYEGICANLPVQTLLPFGDPFCYGIVLWSFLNMSGNSLLLN